MENTQHREQVGEVSTLEKIRATEKHLYLLYIRRRAELDVKIARLQLEWVSNTDSERPS